jgi:predicted phage gp36 major capsid-like protein
MKNAIILALLAASLAAAPAWADEKEDHYKEGTKGVTPHMLKPEQLDQMKKHNNEMEKHLKDMQAEMEKMHTTKDPKERRKLMDEHMKSMRDMMKGMRSSSDEMKMGMMSGGPKAGEPMPEGEKQRQYLIEKRIDMMNMMMEQMGQREDMMKSMK